MEDKLIRVLLIEDSHEDFRLIEEMLKEVKSPSFELIRSSRLDVGLKCLLRDGFDILLLDLNLPDSTGLNTFADVYEQAPEIPIVILTGFDDEDTAIKAVREGAQDYLVKGQVTSPLLSRSISYAIERKLIEDELIRHRYYLNELVEKRTEELETTNLCLQEEISEKEALIEEIYKRIQFTLQMISTVISINPSVKDEDSNDIYIKNQTRVNAIMLFHEILDQSEDFAMINFGKYANDLIDYLFDVYAVNKNLVDINVDTVGILLDISTAIPLGLILNEIISDRLKYDVHDRYKMNISLKQDNDVIILSMNYDMAFKNQELKKEELSDIGFIKTILKQFNGSIECKDEEEIINITLREMKI